MPFIPIAATVAMTAFISSPKKIVAAIAPDDANVTLAGLKGSAPAYILSRLWDEHSRLLFIITPDADTAEELYREMRFYSGSDERVLYFPPWDTAPFDTASPHADIVGQRLNVLFRMMDGRAGAVIVPLPALMQKVLPRKTLGQISQYIVAGEEVERDLLLEKLVKLGYSHVPLVEDRGGFSIRGGILDIFPPDLPTPVRIEFFGDFVDTIRTFDPVTQRSLQPLQELILLPSREVVISEEVLTAFAPRLKRRCDALEIPATRRRELLEQLQSAIYPPGVEYLQPLFHPDLESLFDYCGEDFLKVIYDPAAMAAAENGFAEELAAGERKSLEKDNIVCEINDLFLDAVQLGSYLDQGRRLSIPFLEIAGGRDAGQTIRLQVQDNSCFKLDVTAEGEGVLKPLVEKLLARQAEQKHVLMICHQRNQAQRLYEMLSHYNLPLALSERDFPGELGRSDSQLRIMVGDISRGFQLAEDQLVIIAEEEIFGVRIKRRGVSEARRKQLLTSLAELKPGDYMVHIDFGVGIYRGLQHLTFSGMEGDFLLLEYAGADKLYLPVDRINLVQRYVGAEGVEPHVDKLGGAGWEKTKAKARAAIQEMAGELLKIYAARQVEEGHAFSPPDELYQEFEAAFAYEETPDQQAAIEDVLLDMESKKPMDRLICGDVGYGKTEVALRGAFKAVMDGKQVAVLVPTTVLAQQHLETFSARLKSYPVKVEMLSRFRTPKEQKEIIEGVKNGTVDVVIGTHRLLQKDIVFKDLGLLIIDEEQRFGVTHKERLKKYRAVVDIMTLTATPIPRTLYMSLMGIRDLSIIDTPPVDRLAIKTFVARTSDDLIREAVLRELRRGGQIFFVHNRVQTIGAMAEHLQRIVPEAKIAVGHGQMEEKELERVMLSFMHGESNLLLCTTIIESGLDIPTANTLIVNRADTFGLSQLYQLRGRVGRSKQRAYAYLLIPGEGAISADARERLKIIQELTELGAGFRIATHDLEIRGAGDLLGARQSGDIAAVGFELYTELLEEAIRQLKGEELAERVEPEIKLRIPAFIPEDYVREPNQRLIIYKRLTQATSEEDVAEIMGELVDRFGKLPLAALYLVEVMKLRVALKAMLVKEIEFDGKKLVLSFHQKTPVSPDTIIGLIRQQPKKYQFTPDFRLCAELADTSFDGVLKEAGNLLKTLG
ncbi:transcription-repair coupling factor [Geotalea daltonii FRC-32]|uniref:Transcription-repair-coupling factor n=1 Tax=Geotalea daltonii (strain DSM 22248 / JCM 15807 / FRC-32) TaxID=316067 RepID=B9M729_GEODF|nr:transcription-repair coupling factor [Geotalea daltonii]ACM22050.1 transcription-repair coupling factor [Geotalea daltonii FRC-32]